MGERLNIADSVVFTFGRFQPPTRGHAVLIRVMEQEANRMHAVPIIFPSPSFGDPRNPLIFHDKVRVLRRLFPSVVVSDHASIRDPFEAVAWLTNAGVSQMTVVIGKDREDLGIELCRFAQRVGRMQRCRVVVVPRRIEISGTAMRQAVRDHDADTFQRGLPVHTGRGIANHLFSQIATRLTHSTVRPF